MQCPFCGEDHDKVIDSRTSEGGRAVRRRRQCLACNRRFTTYERPEDSLRITVLKKDETREPYDRQKVIRGLQRACYKRAVSDEQIRRICEELEETMFREYDKLVPSAFIGDTLGRLLRGVDQVAYVRYASVYRNFADLGELIDEAEQLRDIRPPPPGQRPLFQEPPPQGPAEGTDQT